MSVCIATIVSGNYLAYAATLARSLSAHEPTATLRVLVVDRASPAITEAARELALHVTYASDLGIHDFEQIAYKFDIVELNTALKPTFLKSLFAEGFAKVLYLDPDIELHAPLQPVLEALDSDNIVLTPHALAPAMDGRRPSDVDFLRNGTFNLGFIGLRADPEASRLLDWWERRCLDHGFSDPAHGVFVDQKWIDLAPSYFQGVRVLRHPGCNVAYWNLHERVLTLRDGRFEVDGHPLVFFHFSGVRPSDPSVLSKHQTRHAIVPGSALAALVAQYCARILMAGHARLSALPYSFATLDDGTAITHTMRRALVSDGMVESDPFSATSALQRRLKRMRITSRSAGLNPQSLNTLNFDGQSGKVAIVNAAVRLLRGLLGTERLLYLLRYAGVLARQSHYASVLLKEPLDLEHRERRR